MCEVSEAVNTISVQYSLMPRLFKLSGVEHSEGTSHPAGMLWSTQVKHTWSGSLCCAAGVPSPALHLVTKGSAVPSSINYSLYSSRVKISSCLTGGILPTAVHS